MENDKKVICFDFDGVIHRYSNGWQNGKVYDPPMEGAINGIKDLQKKGYKIVICTCRDGDFLENAKLWLSENEIKDVELTNIKPKAIAYIDDKGIRFTDWKDILNRF
jgi:hypothetical protein